jgi:hypothetical protein
MPIPIYPFIRNPTGEVWSPQSEDRRGHFREFRRAFPALRHSSYVKGNPGDGTHGVWLAFVETSDPF